MATKRSSGREVEYCIPELPDIQIPSIMKLLISMLLPMCRKDNKSKCKKYPIWCDAKWGIPTINLANYFHSKKCVKKNRGKKTPGTDLWTNKHRQCKL